MTMMTDTHSAAAPQAGLFSRAYAAIADRLARRAVFNKCMDELASLSNRELADLGLHRSMIRSIAYEEAYGAK
ncbi:DUF1127 domain-containing protein [Pseudooceanicola aestuarii]|uniref:DUF1127 domain-containing protein n=1 Tax=Pseudooceanicola aestuarii TaxID=2697319 RepID=UPI0013D1DC81|nr:DUF1127 domain-containing protein [Pseudooceanicola aestuarii]